MEVFAPVFDENAVELRGGGGGKAFSGAPRTFGTPAAKQAGAAPADVSRRALGDISNKGAGAATGPGKLAAATPRRALGDITNGGATTTLKLAAATKPAAACCAGLPPGSSARTASFVTEAVLAQAALWAADGTETLAGPSGREQRAHEHSVAEAHARARGARFAATDQPFADGAAAASPFDELFGGADWAPVGEDSHGALDFDAPPEARGVLDVTVDFSTLSLPHAGDDCDAEFWGLVDDDAPADG